MADLQPESNPRCRFGLKAILGCFAVAIDVGLNRGGIDVVGLPDTRGNLPAQVRGDLD